MSLYINILCLFLMNKLLKVFAINSVFLKPDYKTSYMKKVSLLVMLFFFIAYASRHFER
jgi:arginine/ornithine N-succinyltransferase beta subunit